MVWFRVDDNLAFHPKAIAAGNAAMGLWVRAGSWCTQLLNDGVVPREIVAALGGNEFIADNLVAAGLWHEHPKGYEFHDWKGYQFTREQVEAERASARERMRNRRSGEQKTNTNVRANFGRSSDAPTLPTPESSKDDSQTGQMLDIDVDGVFEQVWAQWPRKNAKRTAEAKFALAARRHPQGVRGLAADIVEHARAYERFGWTTPEALKYVPHLATWLNGDRWIDPLPGPRSGGSQADSNAAILARYATEGDQA